MPKYKFLYDFGESKPRSLGALIYKDDQAAIAALAELQTSGVPTELWRQERKPKRIATKAADGSVTEDS